MIENFVNAKIAFEDKELDNLVMLLNNCYNKQQSHFAELCFTIYSIWHYCKDNYFKAKDNEVYNTYKLLKKFGFEKQMVLNYKRSYESFCQGDTIQTVSVKEYFHDFSPSKLFEMLPLSYETLENAIDYEFIKPEMTVKKIRLLVKDLKSGKFVETVVEQTPVINEEDIPFVYDPKQEYEYSYFEAKTKNQLLNIIWDLQTAYQKLLKKEKKNGKTI